MRPPEAELGVKRCVGMIQERLIREPFDPTRDVEAMYQLVSDTAVTGDRGLTLGSRTLDL